MKRRSFITIMCALVAAMAMGLLGGCSDNAQQSQPEQSSGNAEDQQQQVEYQPLSIAYLNKAGYEDIIVADNQGFYNDAGPEITLYTVSGSGQQSVEALLAGSADIAATGQGPVADAIAEAASAGKAVIVVTHDGEMAERCCTHRFRLDGVSRPFAPRKPSS